MTQVLIDTNAYSALLRGDREVSGVLDGAETIHVSVIVLGELYAGFQGGVHFQENVSILRRFLDRPSVSVLGVTARTSEVFGTLKNELKRLGTPVPMNDLWIAAQAVQVGATVVSYDAHFLKIKGLSVWEPPQRT